MSIIFCSDAPERVEATEEGCLCAQLAPGWCNGAAPELLAQHADPACARCHGTGVEIVSVDRNPSVNLSNGNAGALLRALGLHGDHGTASLPEARRAVMRARARDLSALERPTEVRRARSFASDGTIAELYRVQSVSIGLDATGLAERIEQFAAFVEASAALGARAIHWE